MDQEGVDAIKRHFDVVAEAVRSDVQAVAEGVSLLADQVRSLETRFDGLEQRFDGLEQRFDGLQHEVQAGFTETRALMRVSYAELDRRLRKLETDAS